MAKKSPTSAASAATSVSGLDHAELAVSSVAAVNPLAEALPAQTRYEDALAELEQLVARMEAGDLALDDLLGQYRRGAQLLHFCRDRLAQVETQVKLLEDGELKPWRGGA